jgi:hypothetical protein
MTDDRDLDEEHEGEELGSDRQDQQTVRQGVVRPTTRTTLSSWTRSGDGRRTMPPVRAEMPPSLVWAPTDTTTATPEPDVTNVPANATLLASRTLSDTPRSLGVWRSSGSDSPVRLELSTLSPWDSMIRRRVPGGGPPERGWPVPPGTPARS